jgi:hypothetical protein
MTSIKIQNVGMNEQSCLGRRHFVCGWFKLAVLHNIRQAKTQLERKIDNQACIHIYRKNLSFKKYISFCLGPANQCIKHIAIITYILRF